MGYDSDCRGRARILERYFAQVSINIGDYYMDGSLERSVESLVSKSHHNSVKPSILLNSANKSIFKSTYLNTPLIEYIEDDEQPHGIARIESGNSIKIVSKDEGEEQDRIKGKEGLLLLSDSRFLIGLRESNGEDQLISIPLADVIQCWDEKSSGFLSSGSTLFIETPSHQIVIEVGRTWISTDELVNLFNRLERKASESTTNPANHAKSYDSDIKRYRNTRSEFKVSTFAFRYYTELIATLIFSQVGLLFLFYVGNPGIALLIGFPLQLIVLWILVIRLFKGVNDLIAEQIRRSAEPSEQLI